MARRFVVVKASGVDLHLWRMNRPRLKIILFCAVLAGSFFALLCSTREPMADGRTLSEWLRLGTEYQVPARMDAADSFAWRSEITNAVLKIGPQAIPVLLEKLKAEDAAWKFKFYNSWTEQFLPYRWLRAARYREDEAYFGFSCLGTQAVTAIPELTKMLSVPGKSHQSATVLAYLGPAAWPILKSGLTNPSANIRAASLTGLTDSHIDLQDVWPQVLARRLDTNIQVFYAAMYLILRRPERPEAVAVAGEGLRHTNPQVQEVTLSLLREWRIDGVVPVVPLIVPLLTNANYGVKRNAMIVLRKVDPTAADANGVPEKVP